MITTITTITTTSRRASITLVAPLLSAGMILIASPAGAGDLPIWGVKSAESPVSSQPPASLFEFTLAAPINFIDRGTVRIDTIAIDVDGLAQLPSSALVGFEITASGSRLIAIDPATAAATPIGPTLPGREIRGAVARPDGMLLVVDAVEETLLVVDPGTGTPVGAPRRLRTGCTAVDVSTACDLAIRSDGVLFFVNSNAFYAVDSATGALQLLHTDVVPLPGGPVFICGLAFTEGTPIAAAYEVILDDDLLTYDTGNAFARTLLVADIIPSFNAGRGDLAAYVDAEPVPLPTTVLADLNDDGTVDGADLGLLLGGWGACPAPPAICCGDLDGDGAVTGADLGLLLGVWSG